MATATEDGGGYDFDIRAVNPELYTLVQRIKAIYAIVGGESAKLPKGKKVDGFDLKKSMFVAHMHNVAALIKTRDEAGLSPGTRDHIRVKNAVSIEMHSLIAELDDLIKYNNADLDKRGGKISAEELLARRDVMKSINDEYQDLFKLATGYAHAESDSMTQAGAGMSTMSVDALKKGTFAGAGMKVAREEMTGEHMQKLAQINKTRMEEDAILDEISAGLDELKDAALKIQDELALQDKMLSDLDAKTDKTQEKLDKTNERLKSVMKVANDRASNFCVYAICFVILLALGVVVYNMLKKK